MLMIKKKNLSSKTLIFFSVSHSLTIGNKKSNLTVYAVIQRSCLYVINSNCMIYNSWGFLLSIFKFYSKCVYGGWGQGKRKRASKEKTLGTFLEGMCIVLEMEGNSLHSPFWEGLPVLWLLLDLFFLHVHTEVLQFRSQVGHAPSFSRTWAPFVWDPGRWGPASPTHCPGCSLQCDKGYSAPSSRLWGFCGFPKWAVKIPGLHLLCGTC